MESTASLTSGRVLLVVPDDDRRTELAEALEELPRTEVRGLEEPRETLYRCLQFGPDLLVLYAADGSVDVEDTLGRLRAEERLSHAPRVVLLTGPDPSTEQLEAWTAAGADEMLRTPLHPGEARLRVRRWLEASRAGGPGKGEAGVAEGAAAVAAGGTQGDAKAGAPSAHPLIETLHVLARLVEYRDLETERHAERVGELAGRLAEEMGLDARTVARIRAAAPLHDIGMVVVPDRVLLKAGDLDESEWRIMTTHTTNGARILGESEHPVLALAREIALTHHERWDGEGYPRGLEGEEIPLPGRIVAVADAFEAMTHDRPFRDAESAEGAVEEIRKEKGRQFDPKVVDALLALKERAE